MIRSQINPYVPLIVGVVATLCSYLTLYLMHKPMCDFTTGALKAVTECTFEFPVFVMTLPLAFFIAGGISTLVLMLWPRGNQD